MALCISQASHMTSCLPVPSYSHIMSASANVPAPPTLSSAAKTGVLQHMLHRLRCHPIRTRLCHLESVLSNSLRPRLLVKALFKWQRRIQAAWRAVLYAACTAGHPPGYLCSCGRAGGVDALTRAPALLEHVGNGSHEARCTVWDVQVAI